MIEFQPSKFLRVFGVNPIGPGYLYVIKNCGKLKIGRSTNPKKRLREARTWIPNVEVIGVNPFWRYRFLENSLNIGLANFWKENEWYDFGQDELFSYFLNEFGAFSDGDINRNSVNFIYVMNSIGMAEFTLEQTQQGTPKKRFLRECTQNHDHG